MVIIQLSVLVRKIIKWENVLNTGKVYKLGTQPVDPYDAFRGRYREKKLNAHALVSVKKGYGVIKKLYIGDTPIEEYVKNYKLK